MGFNLKEAGHTKAQLCNSPFGKWLWHQDNSGITWTEESTEHNDLYPCRHKKNTWRQKSAG